MAIKNYMINDKWLDIAKQNIVEVQSTDGVIGSVKVNGQEYGGGGGSSDFSTAEVTVGAGAVLQAPVLINEEEFQGIAMVGDPMEEEMIWQVPLYKGKCMVNIYTSDEGQTISVSGNITEIDNNVYQVTGNCTITIS